MGYFDTGIPKDLVLALSKSFAIRNFVETGTYKGGTAFWATNHFENVFTIEISAELSHAAAAKPNCPKNIRFIIGDSGTALGDLVHQLNGSTLFWLDGHYSGPGTGGEGDEVECPVIREIEIASKTTAPVILVDDARCFFGPPLPPLQPKNWPSFHDIAKRLLELLPNHYLTIHGDVIVCVPNEMRSVCDSVWSESYSTLYPTKTLPKPIWRRLLNW